ncbi:hypothetical protein [Aurantibacillus circumpalustris]|uniref:hypothetical protein n=1 Tax=Aurantibacillus circumpalustris TaxID=3036359 RepID=UPI00295B0C9D|nr:hypothetical protein [Aurantibacillus circumpalustris]
MQEETKEEFLSRLRKERGLESTEEIDNEEQISPSSPSNGFKAKLKGLFFLVLLALFLWGILQIFGMLKSN